MSNSSDPESFSSKLQTPVALTYDDVLLRPMHSDVEPSEIDVTSRVSDNVELNIPVISAAMDTVTEADMAIAMARQGGLGVIHRNMDISDMTEQIEAVKQADEYFTPYEDVITADPDATVEDIDKLLEAEGVGGAPVVDGNDTVLGIISGTDIRPYQEIGEGDTVRDAMTDQVITAPEDVTAREALETMYTNKIERLPIVEYGDGAGDRLLGIVTMKDILELRGYPDAVRDDSDRLRVGAAVGVGNDEYDRAIQADEAGADVLFLDSAHAHSNNVMEQAEQLYDDIDADLVVGNIATDDAAEELVDVADGLKVGVGPGSICTTRVVSGAGMPQISAIAQVADAVADSEYDIPVIADGGIRYSGDAAKALAAGADAVMLGSYFAGTDEAPGRVITMDGKKYKQYRGMGSVSAMESGGADRYSKQDQEDFVPEGIEAATPYKGTLEGELNQLIGGIQSGMGYVGADTVPTFKERAEFVRVSSAGQREGHPHDVTIVDEAPNYRPQE